MKAYAARFMKEYDLSRRKVDKKTYPRLVSLCSFRDMLGECAVIVINHALNISPANNANVDSSGMALGRSLNYDQEAIVPRGHANMNMLINTEDPKITETSYESVRALKYQAHASFHFPFGISAEGDCTPIVISRKLPREAFSGTINPDIDFGLIVVQVRDLFSVQRSSKWLYCVCTQLRTTRCVCKMVVSNNLFAFYYCKLTANKIRCRNTTWLYNMLLMQQIKQG